MKTKTSDGWYEMFFSVLFKIKGKSFTDDESKKVNGSLREFRTFLKDFIIKEDKLEIRVNHVDEFCWKRVDAGTLICSQKLKLEVVDDSQDWAHRKNLEIEPLCHNSFQKIKFKDAHFGYRFHFSVIDTCFQGEGKSPSWPSDTRIAIKAKGPDYAEELASRPDSFKKVASWRTTL